MLADGRIPRADPGGTRERPPAHERCLLAPTTLLVDNMSARPGKVRVARLTDLAALGELSRLCQTDQANTRSLGLPVNGPPIGMFSLFRLPLGAFRPHDLLYVYEEDGRLAGLLRVERETHRDEWSIVELDAIGGQDAGDIRFRLLQLLLRDAPRRGAVRFHVACADTDGNVELFMQVGFARYGDETLLFRPADPPLPDPLGDEEAQARGIRPAQPLDALALARLYASTTPQPVQRLEAYRLQEWERQGSAWRIPRSSLTPILRFADLEAFVQEAPGGGRDGTQLQAFLQVAVAKEEQPHYLKVLAGPGVDVEPLARFGLGVIAARTRGGGHRHDHGVMSAVRTYESPVDRALEAVGFEAISTVTLLMKETMIRVAEPALVPAVR